MTRRSSAEAPVSRIQRAVRKTSEGFFLESFGVNSSTSLWSEDETLQRGSVDVAEDVLSARIAPTPWMAAECPAVPSDSTWSDTEVSEDTSALFKNLEVHHHSEEFEVSVEGSEEHDDPSGPQSNNEVSRRSSLSSDWIANIGVHSIASSSTSVAFDTPMLESAAGFLSSQAEMSSVCSVDTLESPALETKAEVTWARADTLESPALETKAEVTWARFKKEPETLTELLTPDRADSFLHSLPITDRPEAASLLEDKELMELLSAQIIDFEAESRNLSAESVLNDVARVHRELSKRLCASESPPPRNLSTVVEPTRRPRTDTLNNLWEDVSVESEHVAFARARALGQQTMKTLAMEILNVRVANIDDKDTSGENTRMLNNVLGVPSISIANRLTLVPTTAFWGACLPLLFLFLGLRLMLGVMTVDVRYPLTPGNSVHIHTRNCPTVITLAEDAQSEIFLRSFRWFSVTKVGLSSFFSASPVSVVDDVINVDMRQYPRPSFFHCSTRLAVTPGFKFGDLNIVYAHDEPYIDVLATEDITADSFSLSVLHGFVHLRSINARSIRLDVGDGSLEFQLHGDIDKDYDITDKHSIYIRAQSTPVSLSTKHPMDFELSAEAATKAQIRGVKVEARSKGLTTRFSVLPALNTSAWEKPRALRFGFAGNSAPLYLTCLADRDPAVSSDVWLGQLQAATPAFLDESTGRLAELEAQIANTSSAYVARAYMTGVEDLEGYWGFSSSLAYVGQPSLLFELFSAGLLTPSRFSVNLHVLGLWCRPQTLAAAILASINRETDYGRGTQSLFDLDDDSGFSDAFMPAADVGYPGKLFKNVPHNSSCVEDLIRGQFLSLWREFPPIRSPNLFPYFHNEAADILYDTRHEKIFTTSVDGSSWSAFHVALALHVAFSCVGSIYITYTLHNTVATTYFLNLLTLEQVEPNASHRLEHEINHVPGNQWHLNVIRRYGYPFEEVFMIRWTGHPPSEFSRIGVKVKEVAKRKTNVASQNLEGLTLDEVREMENNLKDELFNPNDIVCFFDSSSVHSVETLAGIQYEVEMPLNNPTWGVDRSGSRKQTWNLNVRSRYRLRLLALNSQNDMLDQSAWSAEVLTDTETNTMELLSWVCRYFKPCALDSLDVFVRRNLRLHPPMRVPIRLAHIELELLSRDLQSLCVIRAPDEKVVLDLKKTSQTPLLNFASKIRFEVLLAFCHSSHQVYLPKNDMGAQKLTIEGRLDQGVDGTYHINFEDSGAIDVIWERSIQEELRLDFIHPLSGTRIAGCSMKMEDVVRAVTNSWTMGREIRNEFGRLTQLCYLPHQGGIFAKLRCKVFSKELLELMVHPTVTTASQLGARPSFVNDLPGKIAKHGSTLPFSWVWSPSAEQPESVYLHAVSHPSREYIFPVNFGRPISNTQSYSWVVDCDLDKHGERRDIIIVMTKTAGKDLTNCLCQTNVLMVTRTLLLAEMEYVYASFCRTFNMEMVYLSEELLRDSELTVTEETISIVPNLRPPLPFEIDEESAEAVYTPGQALVSGESKVVIFNNTDFLPGEGRAHRVDICKAMARKVKIVEDCFLNDDRWWWERSYDGYVLSNDIFYWFKLGLSARVFRGSRSAYDMYMLIHFHLKPFALHCMLVMAAVGQHAIFPLQMALLLLLFNYMTFAATDSPHLHLTSQCVCDFVFDRSLRFLMSLDPPLPQLLVLLVPPLLLEFLMNFFGRYQFLSGAPMVNMVWHLSYTILQALKALFFFATTTGLFMWLIIACLVNSVAYLPYITSVGAVLFVVGSIYRSYAASRAMVSEFVHKNLQELVSLSLNNWFSSSGILFHDGADDGKRTGPSKQSIRKIHKEVRQLSARMMKSWRVLQPTQIRPLNPSMTMVDEGAHPTSEPSARLSDRLVSHDFLMIRGKYAVSDMRRPGFVMGQRNLPARSDWANCAVIRANQSELMDIMSSEDVGLLRDGIVLGPRYHYRVIEEADIPPETTVTCVILVVPVYPHSNLLTNAVKIQMIFEVFDYDQDGGLDALELGNMVRRLGKPSTFMDFFRGGSVDVARLEDYYKGRQAHAELEADYQTSFPVLQSDSESEDGDVFSEAGSEDDAPAETWTSQEASVNEQKLSHIYSSITEEFCNSKMDILTRSSNLLGLRIFEAQYRSLAPMLGGDAVLGLKSNFPDSPLPRALVSVAPFIGFMKHLCLQNFEEQLVLESENVFTLDAVRAVVSRFFDVDIVDEITLKVDTIVNPLIRLVTYDLSPSTRRFLASNPPATYYDVIYKLYEYRMLHDEDVELWTATIKGAGSHVRELQLSWFVSVLLKLELLTDDEVVSSPLGYHDATTKRFQSLTSYKCKREETTEFFLELINKHSHRLPDGSIKPMNVNHLVAVMEGLFSNFLPIHSVHLLFWLVGVDLTQEELPLTLTDTERAACDTRAKEEEGTAFGRRLHLLKERQIAFRNELNIRKIVMSLSSGTGWLAVDLTDEALTVLFDGHVNLASLQICFGRLETDWTNSIQSGVSLVDALDSLGVHEDKSVTELDLAIDRNVQIVDWMHLHGDPGWGNKIFHAYTKLSSFSNGFLSRSQTMEFLRQAQLIMTSEADRQHIPFEAFNRVITRLGWSISRRNSEIMWHLVAALRGFKGTQASQPAGDLADGVLRIFMKPMYLDGTTPLLSDTDSSKFVFGGCITKSALKMLMPIMNLHVAEYGFNNVWNDLHKSPIDITHAYMKLTKEGSSQGALKTVRLSMDSSGADPTTGMCVGIETVAFSLSKMLLTGLWPDSLNTLFCLTSHLDPEAFFSIEDINEVLARTGRKTNRYGLLRVEDVGPLLLSIEIRGITFPMLVDVVERMNLTIPAKQVRRMFNLMDINFDKSLDSEELLGGFEILFGNFLPNLLIEAIGISTNEQLRSILTAILVLGLVVAFLGLAFNMIKFETDVSSTAMQVLFTIVGAVSLNQSSKQDASQVTVRFRTKIEALLGGDLQKRLDREVESTQRAFRQKAVRAQMRAQVVEHKPSGLRYDIPKKFFATLDDPRPCIYFRPGDLVRLEPLVMGHVDMKNVEWKIFPQIPPQTGLRFDLHTGVISGEIPQNYLDMIAFKHDRQHQYFIRSRRTSIQKDQAISNYPLTCRKLRSASKTYVIVCKNAQGSARTRITFRILHRQYMRDMAHTKTRQLSNILLRLEQ